MPPQPWKKLSSRDILRDDWLRLRADRCEIAPGRFLDPFYVLEEFEWVHAVALDRENRVLLVRQYRHPACLFTWELPGGMVAPGEELLAAVQRELLEETGATASHWRQIASAYPNPARQTNRVHAFLADQTAITSPARPDAGEVIECAFFSIPSVFGLIRDGSFAQANHIALFYLALEHLGAITHQPPPTP
jgi:8-oxo-dGTP pyrophosphatase MutT (NUDIX family)